jgi:Transposase zinc-binding domain
MSRPPLEVADVVHQHRLSGALRVHPGWRAAPGPAGYRRVPDRGPWGAYHAVRRLCLEAQAYNSCRHRSCPKCHGAAQAAWLAAREGEVLDTPYVHVIFTLPHDLGPLALQNPRHLYGLLLRTVAQTLQDIAGDPSILGRRSAVSPCCTPGANNSTITPTCIVSCPPGG